MDVEFTFSLCCLLIESFLLWLRFFSLFSKNFLFLIFLLFFSNIECKDSLDTNLEEAYCLIKEAIAKIKRDPFYLFLERYVSKTPRTLKLTIFSDTSSGSSCTGST